jgi:DNA invertase Pin-like site-specific DNA recombinase
MSIYGYCRISTSKQNIDRQIRNIREAFPAADIRQEIYTGTKILNRPEWNKLLKKIKAGDTIVFDSVSRMSRNADEGFATYMELYNNNINLVFLKEQTINTDSYRSLADGQIKLSISTNDTDADELVNDILSVVSKYISKLAEKQIRLAFEQSQKEVDDLHQRTKEGIQTETKRQADRCC